MHLALIAQDLSGLNSKASNLASGVATLSVVIVGILFLFFLMTKGHKAPSGEALAGKVALFLAILALIGYVSAGGLNDWVDLGKSLRTGSGQTSTGGAGTAPAAASTGTGG